MPSAFLSNPFLFGAVAVIAAGIVLYELFNRQKSAEYRSGGGSGNPRPPPDSPTKYKDIKNDIPPPKTRSSDSDSNKCDSSLRKRNIDQSALNQSVKTSTEPKDLSNRQNDFKKDYTQSSAENEPSPATNGNIDKFDEKKYEKNVLDKIMNDTKKVKKISTERLIKNIDSEDSDSENNLPKKHKKNKKKMNINRSDKHGQVSNASNDQSFKSPSVSSICSDENSDPLSSSDSEAWNLDSIAMYKKKLEEALKDELDFGNKGKSPEGFSTSPGCSYESNPNKNPLSIESKQCKGCEENDVNTRASPCNHSYLCLDCAMRVFRLYKKCSICHQNIVEFVSF